MKNTKKIIIVGTIATSIYSFRLDLIKELLKQQYIVYAFTSEYSQENLDKIRDLGVIPVPYELNRGGMNPISDIRSTYALSKQIKDIEPDLVFSYFTKPVIFGTLAAKMAKVPRVIGMLEGLGYTFTDQPQGLSKRTNLIKSVQVLLYKVALPQLDKLIFLNTDDSTDLLERYSIKVNQVEILGGIGLNLKNYPHKPITNSQTPIDFLFIGRLLKEKGIHEFVAAAKIVKKNYSETQFTVLGAIDGANPGALKQSELDELIASKVVVYPGHVDDVQDWIVKSDVFVLPSYREGVPRSTQEAMAIGRAVITTDVPGCRETVVDGVNGFLVEKWNPQALADKMIYFIENPEQIKKMGEESYKMAQENFDADKVNKRLIDMLDL
ncbi:glycosyltransferase family 4 protein [Psychrobacter faecalis]|uniref:Glycosyltransferase family 4 protein n=1 Tax=Psychrobacter faecalis TaxID=180588 RepID=A0ABT9HIY9_9GAMM|nr:glycosyltransferase family 4 protein [Psychrobacter faecalis]MDP4545698.1 glycosyltransferase family 4 protein [Psychrobacter faecalis]